MKRIFLFFNILFFAIIYSQLQNEEKIDPEKITKSSNLLNLKESNFVDFKKGVADFSFNLGSSDLSLRLSYSSEIGKNYKKKLYSYNQGEIGEGFQYGKVCKLVRDHGNTRTIDDDVFYFFYDEANIKLHPVNKETVNNEIVYRFTSEKFSNWLFTYSSQSDKWIIRKDNGNQIILGESSNAKEYTLFYGNWTGPSKYDIENQISISWNISREVTTSNKEVLYEYLKKENPNRINGLNATESIVLAKIASDYGKIIFNYLPKVPNEIYETSISYTEPDGYLDRYSSLFLDNIEIYDNGNIKMCKYQFNYLLPQVSGENKRLLLEINKVTPNSTSSFNEYKFQYNSDGLLEYFYNKYKGSVKFSYKKETFKNLELNILSPDPTKWNQPHFIVQNNYLLVFWQHPVIGTSNINYLLQVYNWTGKNWTLTNVNTEFSSTYKIYLGANAKVGEKPSFQIVSSEDFFGFMYFETTQYASTFDLKQKLFLYNKNVDGKTWNVFQDEKYVVKNLANINSISYFFPQLYKGKDFVLLAAGRNYYDGTFNIYDLINYQWNKSTFNQENLRDTFYSTMDNKIIQHKYNYNGNGDVLNFYHKNMFNEWTSSTTQLNHLSDTAYPFKTNWSFINGTSALRATETGYYIYKWDENYNIVEQNKISDQSFNWANKKESQGGNNTIKLTDKIYNNLLGHYNGKQWIFKTYTPPCGSGCLPPSTSSLRIGENIYIHDSNIGNLFMYNPNSDNFILKKSLGSGFFDISRNSIFAKVNVQGESDGYKLFSRDSNSEIAELYNSYGDKEYFSQDFLGEDTFVLNYSSSTSGIYQKTGTGTRITYRGNDGKFYFKDFNKFWVPSSKLSYSYNNYLTFINNSLNTILVYEMDENAQDNTRLLNTFLPNVFVHRKIQNLVDEIEYQVVDKLEINNGSNNIIKNYYYNNPILTLDNSSVLFENVSEKILSKGGVSYTFDTGISDIRFLGLLKKMEIFNETEVLKSTKNVWSVFNFICSTCSKPFTSYQINVVGKENKDLGITSAEFFDYNERNLLQMHKITYENGDELEKKYLYATDVNNIKLINANVISIPLISEIKKNGYLIEKFETKYENVNNSLPTSLTQFDKQLQNHTEATFDLYDNKGNLLQYKEKEKVYTLIYGYNQTLPLAKIEGATYQSVMNAFGLSPVDPNAYLQLNIVKKSNSDIDEATEIDLIDALKVFRTNSALKDCQISTFTYNPLIGVTNNIDSSGIKKTYRYDVMNRLKSVLNQDGEIEIEYNYNYK
ncbi:hypothetical protein MP477_11495 [Chryseobacterium sp. WG23]|uniref:hypothetical protein n=1 Tax=Chryseobacterium sp. WG23 TaxID=2926910 RepID=UPI00211F0B20|nr:hypothetical protein [Chryseobacterium sp. WG23]MCQ9635583.1 hypothetical protein [Chryseobacterium sp. WG23]